MDHLIALSRMHANLQHFFEFMGSAAPTSSVFAREGVVASVVPATPERSIFNSVAYESANALYAAHAEIDRAYQNARIRAWTVWVMPGDDAVAKFLENRSHKFDGAPVAMALDLNTAALSAPDALDWEHTDDLRTIAGINRAAYGITGPAFEEALERSAFPNARCYLARHYGNPACALMTLDVDHDCGFYVVATLPHARGHGYASRLMSVALAEARARGCTSASLQASPMGYPVYRKLGFLDLGRMSMWELRR
jgi:GNAT superfamily N-acetyltransferase